MEHIKLALDWTPNVNHIGFIAAFELGYYYQAGIDLEILNPQADNYSITPAKKLISGFVDFAIAPFESVISLNYNGISNDVMAVAAILQQDLSAIAVLKSSGINAISDLDGKTYGSYKARYEDLIVAAMIKNGGGKGKFNVVYPNKLGIWNCLVNNQVDATWIFCNWEGVEAKTQGVQLNTFKLADYGIPYGYSPVLITTNQLLKKRGRLYKSFMQASAKGFTFALNQPNDAAHMLAKWVTPNDRLRINLLQTLEETMPHMMHEKGWGYMEETRINAFINWLIQEQIETDRIASRKLFTNSLITETEVAVN